MRTLPRSVREPRRPRSGKRSSASFTRASIRSLNSFCGVFEVGVATRPEESDELDRLVVGRELLERGLLVVRPEVDELGPLVPVLVLVEGGEGRRGDESGERHVG